MIHFIQLIAQGILSGSVVALLALGISLVYRTTGILNLSQGALAALGAYICYSCSREMPMIAAVVTAVVITVVVGVLIGGGLSIRLRQDSPVFALVATLAIGIIISQLIQQFWGSTPVFFPNEIGLAPLPIGPIAVIRVDVWAFVTAAVLAISMTAFMRFTRLGLAMRAVADDVEGARISGLPARRIQMFAWAIGSGLGVIAGFFVASSPSTGPLGPDILDLYLVAALLAAVIGGLGSLPGAVVGAVLIWTVQSLFVNYAPSFNTSTSFVDLGAYKNSFLFLILIFVLLVAPTGLLGSRSGRRI